MHQLRKATERLKEVLDQEKNEFIRDSAIQRFEFTLDLAWKTIKGVLEKEKGIVCTSPKECVREAYRQNMIGYDEFWLKMIDLRNEAAHMYSEEKSEEIYSMLPRALEKFYELLSSLGQQVDTR
ncbi:hypothetical protein A3A21_02715 [Candidatus Jorgensenbacteria bacterium RIFCSPLOWO2_01_FULL_45_25b]|uniref:Nucleotidyltransferase n=1 Tax=Candidatus Jorgensenbacteria bacterium RIFCSPLOWO2_01_FULL_45_25b TaxID=1798471 RepID=A0A1F6BZX0_9BACT|nr:MAG: hypothetical protein A3A21_02715 [Candidatus Jorgensenbacteria bacterium RIFCSPLOWO2_01_FULL_45_25b]